MQKYTPWMLEVNVCQLNPVYSARVIFITSFSLGIATKNGLVARKLISTETVLKITMKKIITDVRANIDAPTRHTIRLKKFRADPYKKLYQGPFNRKGAKLPNGEKMY